MPKVTEIPLGRYSEGKSKFGSWFELEHVDGERIGRRVIELADRLRRRSLQKKRQEKDRRARGPSFAIAAAGKLALRYKCSYQPWRYSRLRYLLASATLVTRMLAASYRSFLPACNETTPRSMTSVSLAA